MIVTCKGCGVEFKAYPSDARIYCSTKCFRSNTVSCLHKHGESATRLHAIWCGMRSRCKGSKSQLTKKYYRDRGITVCSEWDHFETFRDWAIENGYQDNLELDRRDNNLGYSPANCRWATRSQQMSNTRKRVVKNVSSKYKGVQKYRNRWKATITENGKPKHLGCFDDEESAAKAYDAYALRLYGDFASTNFEAEKEMSTS